MAIPIKQHIQGVFIPVRDLQRSKEWYTRVLDLEEEEEKPTNENLFFTPLDGCSGLILDTMPNWRNKEGDIEPYRVPVIQLPTDNIEAAYEFMKENEVEIVTEIIDGYYFVIQDPDGNLIMINNPTK